MTMTNFPNGLTSWGVPLLSPGGMPAPVTGNVLFVNNSTAGAADGNIGSYDQPLSTVDAAIGRCAASAGWVIYVGQGHAETVSGAGSIAQDVIGVTIIGCGTGNNRPVFTFSAVASTWTISAANCAVYNIVAVPSVDVITSPFVVSAAGCTIGVPGYPLEWQDASSTVEVLRVILTTAAADNLRVDLVHRGFTAGTHNVNSIRLVGCNNGVINVDQYGIVSTAVVEFLTTACSNIQITGNFYVSGTTNLSKNVVDTVGGSTYGVNGFDAAAGAMFSGGSGSAPHADVQERTIKRAAATMVTATDIFTIAGGPIEITALMAVCVTSNNCVASTLLWTTVPTVGSAQTISAASASLSNAAAGGSITLAGTALATAALFNASGANLIANPGTIVVQPGTIRITIAVGSTTGTWAQYLRYKPLAVGVTVT